MSKSCQWRLGRGSPLWLPRQTLGLTIALPICFVLTSRVESFPRVILEAMAHAIPILTTPVFGVAEQIKEGYNARCFAPGDVNTLAEHLCDLILDQPLRRRMSAASRECFLDLRTFDQMVDEYSVIFRETYLSY